MFTRVMSCPGCGEVEMGKGGGGGRGRVGEGGWGRERVGDQDLGNTAG